ncbi:FecR family protein [Ulvibacterium sp.]|uniref:FecR family protein n=1 Tax=Ulvibacterium sp. TaxID=2665914 RepID=UPI003BAA00B9
MPNKEQLKSVLESINISGKIDLDSLKEFTEQEKEIIYNLYSEGLVEEALKSLDSLDEHKEWRVLREKLGDSRVRIIPLWKSALKYAAIFVGLLGTLYFILKDENLETQTQISEESIKLRIGQEAIKVLHEGQTQKLVSSSGKVVGEQKGNKLVHIADTEIDELVYNELEIPYGKIFDVELSDGTLVHLNSGTTIRYPIKFLQGQKREVFIDGEAYFKVATDKNRPFIVNADAVAIEVLGTEFNVTSYAEDLEIRTVLVEGSVNMTNSNVPGDVVVLKPGYKASWNKTVQATEIEEVDVLLYTGWIEGELVFRNSNFQNMVKKLERRYNVTIRNNNLLLRDKKFNARFDVDIESMDDILKSIKEIHPFEYKITDQEIVIN